MPVSPAEDFWWTCSAVLQDGSVCRDTMTASTDATKVAYDRDAHLKNSHEGYIMRDVYKTLSSRKRHWDVAEEENVRRIPAIPSLWK